MYPSFIRAQARPGPASIPRRRRALGRETPRRGPPSVTRVHARPGPALVTRCRSALGREQSWRLPPPRHSRASALLHWSIVVGGASMPARTPARHREGDETKLTSTRQDQTIPAHPIASLRSPRAVVRPSAPANSRQIARAISQSVSTRGSETLTLDLIPLPDVRRFSVSREARPITHPTGEGPLRARKGGRAL